MKIRSIRHKGLRALIEGDDARGVRADQVKRLRNMLAALIYAETVEDMKGPPGWRLHPLTGDRAGTWSLSVSGNWRLTFVVEQGEIAQLNLEDYH